jgi:hypothetical protein
MSTKEQRERIELLQGTLDLLILRTLLLAPAHGNAIAKAIEFKSDDVLQVDKGHCTQRCTGSSSGDGFRSKRASQRTIAEPSSTS